MKCEQRFGRCVVFESVVPASQSETIGLSRSVWAWEERGSMLARMMVEQGKRGARLDPC